MNDEHVCNKHGFAGGDFDAQISAAIDRAAAEEDEGGAARQELSKRFGVAGRVQVIRFEAYFLT